MKKIIIITVILLFSLFIRAIDYSVNESQIKPDWLSIPEGTEVEINGTKWSNYSNVITRTNVLANCIPNSIDLQNSSLNCCSVFYIENMNAIKPIISPYQLKKINKKGSFLNEIYTYSSDSSTFIELPNSIDTSSVFAIKSCWEKKGLSEQSFDFNFSSGSFKSFIDPVTGCANLTTQNETYTIGGEGQILNSTGTCIEISNNSITLDCEGGRLNYSNDAGSLGYGVLINGYDGVTIKNCKIYEGTTTTSSKNAIYGLNGVIGLNITNSTIVTVGASSLGIFIDGASSSQSTVENNSINTTGSSAIGLRMRNTPFSTVRGNVINTSGGSATGIDFLSPQSSSLIENNVVFSKSQIALYIGANAISNIIRYNKFISSALSSQNVRFDNGVNNTFFESNEITALGSSTIGIYLNGASIGNNTFLNNNISATSNDYEIEDDTTEEMVNYLIYNNSFGEMKWVGNYTKNLTVRFTENGVGLDKNIFIGNNTVSFDTSSLSSGFVTRINASLVNITMKGLGYSRILRIMKIHNYTSSEINDTIINAGFDCIGSGCTNNSYSGGILNFNTTSLGSFSASQLVGFPDCGTISANFDMTQSITNAGTCLNITSSNIIVDCHGYTINYSTSGTLGYGIFASNVKNITIVGCNIQEGSSQTNSKHSIWFRNVNDSFIMNSTILLFGNRSIGILTTEISNNNIINFTIINVSQAYLSGIYGEGINITDGKNNKVISNKLYINGTNSTSISLGVLTNNSLLENNIIKAEENGTIGIYLVGSASNNTFLNNNISSRLLEILDYTSSNNINYFNYNNSFGSLRWIDNGIGSFNRNLSLNISNDLGIGIDLNIFIGNITISINKSSSGFISGYQSSFNSSINMTMYKTGLPRATKVREMRTFETSRDSILNNGRVCNDYCSIINYSNTNSDVYLNSSFLNSFTLSTNRNPVIVSLEPQNGNSFNSNPTITIDITEPENETLNITIFGETTNPPVTPIKKFLLVQQGIYTFEWTGLTSGEWYFFVNVTDSQAEGDISSEVRHISYVGLITGAGGSGGSGQSGTTTFTTSIPINLTSITDENCIKVDEKVTFFGEKGSLKNNEIILKNICNQTLNIDVSCSGDVCTYLNFNKKISLVQNEKNKFLIGVTLPQEITDESFATLSFGKKNVDVKVLSTSSIYSKIKEKIFSEFTLPFTEEKDNPITMPIILLYFVIFLIIFGGTYFIIHFTLKKLSFIIAFLIALISIIFIIVRSVFF